MGGLLPCEVLPPGTECTDLTAHHPGAWGLFTARQLLPATARTVRRWSGCLPQELCFTQSCPPAHVLTRLDATSAPGPLAAGRGEEGGPLSPHWEVPPPAICGQTHPSFSNCPGGPPAPTGRGPLGVLIPGQALEGEVGPVVARQPETATTHLILQVSLQGQEGVGSPPPCRCRGGPQCGWSTRLLRS